MTITSENDFMFLSYVPTVCLTTQTASYQQGGQTVPPPVDFVKRRSAARSTPAGNQNRRLIHTCGGIRRFIDETGRILDFLIPLYRREGKSYLTVALGCTGGRHRSPVLARAIAERLRQSGFAATVRDAHIAR